MGNKQLEVNIEKAFPNLMDYQRKEVLKNFTKSELQLLYLLFLSLKSRSLSDGIDKEAFHHFCQMPGLWGQRLFEQFLRKSKKESISFDEFVYSLYLACRSSEQDQDHFIFDLFHLDIKKKEISKEELITMIYNLPSSGLITSKAADLTIKQETQKKPEALDFCIEKSPKKNTLERLIIADKKYHHMVPEQINAIINKMLGSITSDNLLTFTDFRKWLDMNPSLRSIIQDALRPNLWTIVSHEKPVLKLAKHESSSTAFHNRIQGDFTAKAQQELEHDERSGRLTLKVCGQKHDHVTKAGELLKIGKKTSMLVKRHYVLQDGALIVYQNKGDLKPHNLIFLNGIYVEPVMEKGLKGIRLFHECEYFKERVFLNKNPLEADKWLAAIRAEAEYYDFNQKYEKLNMIGKGKFSQVFLCKNRETDELVAMKLIDKTSLTMKEKDFLREEIQIIRQIQHPNVVVMKDVYETAKDMYILMECVQGGELFDYIKSFEISEEVSALIVYQILEALQYLHLCGIVHRDLKPENILIETDSQNRIIQIKLTDFGLSKIIIPNEQMFDACGTPAYVAPEVLHKQGYYKEVDIWSTGVILYTMLSRTLPFHSTDRKQTFKMIKEANPDLSSSIWKTFSAQCKDLISKMLIKDPKERISVEDALKHPFFQLHDIHKTTSSAQTSKFVRIDSQGFGHIGSSGGDNASYAQIFEESSSTRIMMPVSLQAKGLKHEEVKEAPKKITSRMAELNMQDELIRSKLKNNGIRRDKEDELHSIFKLPKIDPSRTLPANFKLDTKLLDQYVKDEENQQKHFLLRTTRLLSENDLDH